MMPATLRVSEINKKWLRGILGMRGFLFAVAAIVAAVCCSQSALAQQEGTFVIPEFQFEKGGKLTDMKVGYITWGKLDDAKDNALLILPATNAPKAWAAQHIGPGKTFDTDKYFVIGVDPIGSGTSSQPADGLGTQFPKYTIRDMVRAQYQLLTKQFGLTHAYAIGGASMGSFQSVEWGVTYPGFARGLLLWVPAARSDRHFQAIVDAVNAVIMLDPAYKNGKYDVQPVEGMRRAGMVYFPWLYSDEYLAQLTKDADFQRAEMAFGDGWAKTWDANTLIWRYEASRNHDASEPFGGDMQKALSKIEVPVLIISSSTDRTVPAYLTDELEKGLKNVKRVVLQTRNGHLGYLQPQGTAEYQQLHDASGAFLDSLGK
jgi:homoserine O-acetyltransferase/O-succinyltransferase